jgi:hypothetical protein
MATKEGWEELEQERRASGQSIAAFCRERGIKESSYQYMRAKYAERRERSFVRVAGAEQHFELELPSGAKLRMPCEVPAKVLQHALEAVNALGCK